MRHTNTAVPVKLSITLNNIGTAALPCGCYAVCHTPCFSYSLRSGSYLCPSSSFFLFVLCYVTFRSATFHFAPCCIQSAAFSPPAAYNLACLAACHSCGFVIVFVPKHNALTTTKTCAKPLRLIVAVYRLAMAWLFIQHCGRRTQPRPFVPLSHVFLSARSAPLLQGGQVCHPAKLLFCRRLFFLLSVIQKHLHPFNNYFIIYSK